MTNQFLDDPSQDNFIKYKALSETKQGALSSRMKAIGVCMFVLSACVFAFAVAATSIPAVGVAVALGGVGLFALGRRGDDVGTVFRDMNDLAAVVSPTQPAMSQ